MMNGQTLQLADLPTRQPNVGSALLRTHAIAAVIRLSLDPSPSPSGTMSREVKVEWARKTGNEHSTTLIKEIGWDDVPDLVEGLATFPLTWNDHELTEYAAIALMALLIENLEGGILERVLQIGSGGDFLVLTRRARKHDQIEVSGIRKDTDGQETRRRLTKKSSQVLTGCDSGFASVTAFSHPPDAVVHSCLHYVRRRKKRKRQR